MRFVQSSSMENDYFVQSFMTFGCALWPPAINVALLFRSFIVFHISQQNARTKHLPNEDKLQTCSHLTYQQLVALLRMRWALNWMPVHDEKKKKNEMGIWFKLKTRNSYAVLRVCTRANGNRRAVIMSKRFIDNLLATWFTIISSSEICAGIIGSRLFKISAAISSPHIAFIWQLTRNA